MSISSKQPTKHLSRVAASASHSTERLATYNWNIFITEYMHSHVVTFSKDENDWVKKCMDFEVEDVTS